MIIHSLKIQGLPVSVGDLLKIKSIGSFYTTHRDFVYYNRRSPNIGENVLFGGAILRAGKTFIILNSVVDCSVFYMSSDSPEIYLEYPKSEQAVTSIYTHGVDIHVTGRKDEVDHAVKKIESAFFPERKFKVGDRFKVGRWSEYECVLVQVGMGEVQFICVEDWNRYSDSTHSVKNNQSISISELSLGEGVFITPL
jgi:hypothetical protein